MTGRLLMCFFTAIALGMRFETPEGLSEAAGGSRVLNVLYNFQLSLTGTMAVTTVIFIAICLLEMYLYKKGETRNILLCAICFIVAVVWAMGESFRRVDSLALWHDGAGQAVKTVLYVLGTAWFLTQAAMLLSYFLESGKDWKCKKKYLAGVSGRHPFATSFVTIFLCWLPHLLLSYPATLCIDVWNQLLQFFGRQNFTSHHPPAHTVLAGFMAKLGARAGSGNFGLFLFVLCQTVLFALIMAYMFDTMQKLDSPAWLKAVTFLTAVISPYYTQYIGMVVKDTLYSYFILLFVIEIVYMEFYKEQYWSKKKHLLLLGISMTGSILFRNNGKYVIYPMAAVVLFKLLFGKNRKGKGRILGTAMAVFALSIGISSGVQGFLVSHYQIEKGSIKEALSLPFQQTARYVKEHGNEVTKEERQAISAVLAYRRLPKLYNPKICDPVKSTFKRKASAKDLKRYFEIWMQQGMKHPVTYIEATMNQNYYLLYPLVENNTLYDTTELNRKASGRLAGELGIHEVPAVQRLDEWRTGVNKVLFTLPVTGLLSSMAFFNLILIYLCYSAVRRRASEMFSILMPLLLSAAVIVLAPVIKGHPRYAFPIIYSVPVVFAALLYFINKRNRFNVYGSGKNEKKKAA